MIYIFTFLGEFGFELFNWQGVIRKFATTISPDDQIVCCSRANLYPLYESADLYVDISEVELFKNSRAGEYYVMCTDKVYGWNSLKSIAYDRQLKAKLRPFIAKNWREKNILYNDNNTLIKMS